eukprot:365989-Chlamydomonas_euryale.AAC.2
MARYRRLKLLTSYACQPQPHTQAMPEHLPTPHSNPARTPVNPTLWPCMHTCQPHTLAMPADVRYLGQPRPGRGEMEALAASAVEDALAGDVGDVLVFLPGVGEIRT